MSRRRPAARGIALAFVVLGLHACAPLAVNEPRAGTSSLGCIRAALNGQTFTDRPDRQAHCIAAGLIARRCSIGEAWLASYGKELQDLLGRGDAEWRDLRADGQGIHCARSATDQSGLIACCSKAANP